MRYSPEFFELNLEFAQRVALVTGDSLANALLDYTYLYGSFNIGRDFDPQHPTWQTYLAGLAPSLDQAAWTWEFYLTQAALRPRLVPEPSFGCFYYTFLPDGGIRIHFFNGEVSLDRSPLSASRREKRLAELRRLYAHLNSLGIKEVRVLGASWLYNLEAYRQLFPPAYLATARASYADFRYIVLWGQFVDRYGRVRPQLAERFRERLHILHSLDGLQTSFPFCVLHLQSPVERFYEFYRAERNLNDEGLE